MLLQEYDRSISAISLIGLALGKRCHGGARNPLDLDGLWVFALCVLRQLLKSKLHRAMITEADVDYEGSIEIPRDLMDEVGLWEGEKVLVASITTGNRLETYVQPGVSGSGKILINGGAAHRIKKGERVAIMAFALSAEPIQPKKVLLNDQNVIIRKAN